MPERQGGFAETAAVLAKKQVIFQPRRMIYPDSADEHRFFEKHL